MTRELYFVGTLVSVKYNKTLSTGKSRDKYCTLVLLVLVLYLPFDSCIIYFIQTGSSALSNTYWDGIN